MLTFARDEFGEKHLKVSFGRVSFQLYRKWAVLEISDDRYELEMIIKPDRVSWDYWDKDWATYESAKGGLKSPFREGNPFKILKVAFRVVFGFLRKEFYVLETP